MSYVEIREKLAWNIDTISIYFHTKGSHIVQIAPPIITRTYPNMVKSFFVLGADRVQIVGVDIRISYCYYFKHFS